MLKLLAIIIKLASGKALVYRYNDGKLKDVISGRFIKEVKQVRFYGHL
jgi:hypothetical protein